MSKRGYFLLLLLLAAVLIAGCAPAEVPEPPTDPAPVQTDPPTEPPTELSRPEAVEFFQELLTWGEDRRYSQALGCVFEAPEQLSVHYFFYNGVGCPGSWGSLTDAERDCLLQAGFIDEMDLQIMPAQTLEELLQRYFGVGLDAVEIPAGWAYNADSDCYYTNHNDAWGCAADVTGVTETAEGLIRVFYTTDFVYSGGPDLDDLIADASMILTLQPMEDGSYRMISNVIAE